MVTLFFHSTCIMVIPWTHSFKLYTLSSLLRTSICLIYIPWIGPSFVQEMIKFIRSMPPSWTLVHHRRTPTVSQYRHCHWCRVWLHSARDLATSQSFWISSSPGRAQDWCPTDATMQAGSSSRTLQWYSVEASQINSQRVLECCVLTENGYGNVVLPLWLGGLSYSLQEISISCSPGVCYYH